MYKPIFTLDELKKYLEGAALAAFDFETAPLEKYRKEEKAALDAHKSRIVGISFSIAEGSGVYLPLAHRLDGSVADGDTDAGDANPAADVAGRDMNGNAKDQPAIWQWLENWFTDPTVTKIAHNLAFESQFLYARGIVIQEPCYDTIAAAQLVYKGEDGFRGLGDCGLKTLASEWFEEHMPTYADVVGNRHFDELDPSAETTVRYACADADYSLRIYHLV